MLNGFTKGEQYKHIYRQMYPVGVYKPVCDKTVSLPVVVDHKRAEQETAKKPGIVEGQQRYKGSNGDNNDGDHRS